MHDPGKYRGILLSQVPVGEGFRCKDQEKSSSEKSSKGYVRSETDGREETGGTGQYGSGVRRPGEMTHTQRDGDGDTTVDGSTRSLRARTRRQQQEWWWEKELSLIKITAAGHLSPLLFIATRFSGETVVKDALKNADTWPLANGKQELGGEWAVCQTRAES